MSNNYEQLFTEVETTELKKTNLIVSAYVRKPGAILIRMMEKGFAVNAHMRLRPPLEIGKETMQERGPGYEIWKELK